MYKIGSTNTEMNKLIQEAVGAPIDGIFGPLTQRYVINWQSANNLVADGIVGPKTLDAMGILDTDIKEHHVVDTEFDLTIEKYYLSKGQYIEQEISAELRPELCRYPLCRYRSKFIWIFDRCS